MQQGIFRCGTDIGSGREAQRESLVRIGDRLLLSGGVADGRCPGCCILGLAWVGPTDSSGQAKNGATYARGATYPSVITLGGKTISLDVARALNLFWQRKEGRSKGLRRSRLP